MTLQIQNIFIESDYLLSIQAIEEENQTIWKWVILWIVIDTSSTKGKIFMTIISENE